MRSRVLAQILFFISIVVMSASCIPTTPGSSGREAFLATDDNATTTTTEEDSAPVRPTGQVFIEPDFCLCRLGRPFISGTTCVNTCTSFPGDQYTLTGRTTFGDQILLDEIYGDTKLVNWCNLSLPNIDSNEDGVVETVDQNSKCSAMVRESFSGGSEVAFDLPVSSDDRFQIEFQAGTLEEDKTYSFRIRAKSDLTEGFSDYIQFLVKDSQEEFDYGGQLRVGSAKRYYCIRKARGDDGNFANFFIQHFMFDAANDPPVMPAGSTDTICHNEQLGMPDTPLYPRLGEEFAFNIWDKVERRFFTNYPNGIDGANDNAGGSSDINYFVSRLVADEFNISISGDIFTQLNAPNFPGTTGTAATQTTLGFMLLARQDVTNSDDFICPGTEELLRTKADEDVDPIFYVMNKYNFLSETEGLYLALRTPREFNDTVAVDDILYINESLLHQIWWYKNTSNVPQLGPERSDTDYVSIVQSKTMYFYWPYIANSSPLVQSPSQKTYKIVTTAEAEAEINGTTPNLGGTAGPPDKKLGCIPKTTN